MELEDAIKTRRSIRNFKDQLVPKQLLQKIIETAIWAPSAMNTQPWHFIVLTGKDKDKLTEIAGKSFERLQHRLRQLFKEKMVQFISEYFKNFGNAPVIITVLTEVLDERVYQIGAIESVSALIQNLLLCAHAEGLGTCWMTGPLWVEDDIKKYLCIGDDRKLVALIAIGYADQVPPIPPRKAREIKWLGFKQEP